MKATLKATGNWFGWRLMAEDGMPFNGSAPGFSAGALGMANTGSAEEPFALILQATYADVRRADGGHKLAGRDQAFANYVLRKLGRFDIATMTQFLTLHRLDIGGPQFPEPEDARGLVNFLGAPAEEKLTAMRAYVAALDANLQGTVGSRPSAST
jgi:hypothetical protein